MRMVSAFEPHAHDRQVRSMRGRQVQVIGMQAACNAIAQLRAPHLIPPRTSRRPSLLAARASQDCLESSLFPSARRAILLSCIRACQSITPAPATLLQRPGGEGNVVWAMLRSEEDFLLCRS